MIRRLLRFLLTNPAAMAIKARVNDAWWTVKGRGIAPPVLPGQLRSILFVCQGNICRSPFAAEYARKRLHDFDRSEVVSASGGLRTNQAANPPAEARIAARAFDVDLDAHRPVQISPTMVESFDLVVVMEVRQLEAVRAVFPASAARTVLLPLFGPPGSGYARYNIRDPFGQSQDTFNRCYARIQGAVDGLIGAIVKQARDVERPDSRVRSARQ